MVLYTLHIPVGGGCDNLKLGRLSCITLTLMELKILEDNCNNQVHDSTNLGHTLLMWHLK
jgi:hypothetical protein